MSNQPIQDSGRKIAFSLFFFLTITGVVFYLVHLVTGFNADRVIGRPFQLFSVYWSGITLLLSFCVGFAIAQTQPVVGLTRSATAKLFRPLTILLLGWIGARFFDVIFVTPVAQAQGIRSAADYFANPIFLLDLNWGGLSVWGALFFVGAWLLWLSWRIGAPFSAVIYKGIVGFFAGLSLMQWGHFLTQELYGYPWGGWGSIEIDSAYRLPQFLEEPTFVPIFLFAAIWYFAGTMWLAFGRRWQRSNRGHAEAVVAGLLWFVVGRLCIELATPNTLFNWLPASVILVVIVALGLWNQRSVISTIRPQI